MAPSRPGRHYSVFTWKCAALSSLLSCNSPGDAEVCTGSGPHNRGRDALLTHAANKKRLLLRTTGWFWKVWAPSCELLRREPLASTRLQWMFCGPTGAEGDATHTGRSALFHPSDKHRKKIFIAFCTRHSTTFFILPYCRRGILNSLTVSTKPHYSCPNILTMLTYLQHWKKSPLKKNFKYTV